MSKQKSWVEFECDIDALVKMMDDYVPDVIVPSMCGGLVPAGIVTEKLSVKLGKPFRDLRPISIERFNDERRIAYDVIGDISGLNVLLLEDDLPTGQGFLFVKEEFERRGAHVKICAVYVNDISVKIADFYGEHCSVLPNLPWKPARDGNRLM